MVVSSAPAPVGRENLFFGLLLEGPVADQVARLARELRVAHGLRGKPTATARLHMTLLWLGSFGGGVPRDVLDCALEAGARVLQPAFAVELDQVLSFAGRREHPFVLCGTGGGVAGPVALHLALWEAVYRRSAPHAPFTPHVTLLRDTVRVLPHPVSPVRWEAAAFSLLLNRVGSGLPYAELGRWPLAAERGLTPSS